MLGFCSHEAIAASHERRLALLDHRRADCFLELKDEAGADRLDDRRGTGLLAVLDLVVIVVFGGAHVPHGAAARHVGHPVGEQVTSCHEHAWCARPTDQLVRRNEDGVLVGQIAVGARSHVDRDVGRRRRKVPQRHRTVFVQECRHRHGVGDDARDVGCRRERPDERRSVGVPDEFAFEMFEADVAVGVLVDDHQVGDRLAPGQLVGMMLVWSDEHHRARPRRGSKPRTRSGPRASRGSSIP